MKVTIICSSFDHPIYSYLSTWKSENDKTIDIEIVTSAENVRGGDILFLISCSQIINKNIRDLYKVALVIHASDVPKGRGWSPHIWQIIGGYNKITISLMEVEDKVDSGMIWHQQLIELEGHELFDEINSLLFTTEIRLINYAIKSFQSVKPYPQPNIIPSYYSMRTPEDSEINTDRSIKDVFNLLRVADPDRYPAYFYHLGKKFKIRIEKVD
jgi:methionyl-tRNA formyltransferase